LPHRWSITGVWRFGEEWIALGEGPDRDYLDASGSGPQGFTARPSPTGQATPVACIGQ
jgi:hypothetical protein